MPETDLTKLRWAELETALGHLNRAGFEVDRAARVVKLESLDAARTWIEDVRRSLGSLALLLSETPDAAGYAALLGHVLTPPRSTAEAEYIERHGTATPLNTRFGDKTMLADFVQHKKCGEHIHVDEWSEHVALPCGDCSDAACDYQEPHIHGFACGTQCPCKGKGPRSTAEAEYIERHGK